MAWIGDKLSIYNPGAIKRARRKASRQEKQADFADQVQSAIDAGIPVTIIPYQGKPRELTKRQEKRQEKISKLKAEIAILKAARKDEKPRYRQGMGSEFYKTWEWRGVRFDVLRASNGKCQLCGRGKQDGIILHVDHIKPRSKYPELELVATNLQVLCEDCNIGKSNK